MQLEHAGPSKGFLSGRDRNAILQHCWMLCGALSRIMGRITTVIVAVSTATLLGSTSVGKAHEWDPRGCQADKDRRFYGFERFIWRLVVCQGWWSGRSGLQPCK